jgi:hypothetical protein
VPVGPEMLPAVALLELGTCVGVQEVAVQLTVVKLPVAWQSTLPPPVNPLLQVTVIIVPGAPEILPVVE